MPGACTPACAPSRTEPPGHRTRHGAQMRPRSTSVPSGHAMRRDALRMGSGAAAVAAWAARKARAARKSAERRRGRSSHLGLAHDVAHEAPRGSLGDFKVLWPPHQILHVEGQVVLRPPCARTLESAPRGAAGGRRARGPACTATLHRAHPRCECWQRGRRPRRATAVRMPATLRQRQSARLPEHTTPSL